MGQLIESDYGFLKSADERISFLYKIFNFNNLKENLLKSSFTKACNSKFKIKPNNNNNNNKNTMPTFAIDNYLPNLPLPDLDKTIQKYLESIKPFVSELEFQRTESICNKFKNGIGYSLHTLLKEKSRKERNWVTFFSN
jgi:hypothetical protein